MTSSRVRLSIDPELWAAAEAVAKARRMTPSAYVEEALRTMLGPVAMLHTAAELAGSSVATLAEISDQIRIIADEIVDQHQANGNADYMDGSSERVANASETR